MTKTRSIRFSKRRRGGRKTLKRRGGRRRSRVRKRRGGKVKSRVSKRGGRRRKSGGNLLCDDGKSGWTVPVLGIKFPPCSPGNRSLADDYTGGL